MALLELTDRIYTALDNNEYAILSCFQKCTDMVFMVMFISDSVTMFFIENKYVFMNGHESKRNIMQYGVPQGSISFIISYLYK